MAIKKLDAKECLDRLNVLPDGGNGHAEFIRRCRESTRSQCGLKGSKSVQM